MARSNGVGNVEITTETFLSWVTKTNELLYSLRTEIVTVNTSVGNTGSIAEKRNGRVVGVFGANSLVATDELCGGTVGGSRGLLRITSDTFIGGNSSANASFVNCQANVWIDNANTQVNAQIITITGNTSIKGHSSVVAINVLGNSTVTNTVIDGTNLFVRTNNTSINSISTITGNTFVKANSSITLITVAGNGTTSNVILSGNLTQITSNLDVTGTVHTVAGNVAFDTATLFVDSAGNKVGVGTTTPDANLHVNGTANISGVVRFANTLTVIGNSTFANVITVTGNATFANTVKFANVVTFENSNSHFVDHIISSFANSNISSTDTTSPLTIFTFNKSSYSSAKIIAQVKGTTGNTQTSEMVLAHDAACSAFITVYATVSSPSTADLGDYSVDINGTNVELKFKQNFISTASKVIATLIK